jgi:hypothetical protein
MATLGSRSHVPASPVTTRKMLDRAAPGTAGKPYPSNQDELTSRVASSTLKNRYRLLLHENVESHLKVQRLTECLSQPTRCCQWIVLALGKT